MKAYLVAFGLSVVAATLFLGLLRSSKNSGVVKNAAAAPDDQKEADRPATTPVAMAVSPTHCGIAPGVFRSPGGQEVQSEAALTNVVLKVENTDPTQKPKISGFWNAKGVTLTDDLGNSYDMVPFVRNEFHFRCEPAIRIREGTTIYSGQPLTETLYFERPVPAAKSLTLRLPVFPLGGEGFLKFSFPAPKPKQ